MQVEPKVDALCRLLLEDLADADVRPARLQASLPKRLGARDSREPQDRLASLLEHQIASLKPLLAWLHIDIDRIEAIQTDGPTVNGRDSESNYNPAQTLPHYRHGPTYWQSVVLIENVNSRHDM
jgi:hypothetical protein